MCCRTPLGAESAIRTCLETLDALHCRRRPQQMDLLPGRWHYCTISGKSSTCSQFPSLKSLPLRWHTAGDPNACAGEKAASKTSVGPLYGAGLRLVPSFAALQLRMAAMNDLQPPSCCSTTECIGFLLHLAPICCTASFLSSFSLSSLLARHNGRRRFVGRCASRRLI